MLAGTLLGIGFIAPLFWIFGFFGVVYFLYLTQQEQSKKSLYLGAWSSWTTKSLVTLSWFWTTYPIEWLPLEFGKIQPALIFMYWFTSSVWLGAGGLVAVFLYKLLQKYCQVSKKYLVFLIFPLVWVAGEIVGSLSFSIMMYGPGGSVNTAYSFGYTGYLLGEHDLFLQFARLGGVYILSLLFAFFSAAIFYVTTNRTAYSTHIMVACLLLVYITSLVSFVDVPEPVRSESYKVISVDTTLPKGPMRDRATTQEINTSLNNAVLAALEEEPDYILFPEDSRYFDQEKTVGSNKELFKLKFNEPNVVLIDSGRAEIGDKTVLQTFIYNGALNPVERVQKRYLVPQGEYIPSLYASFLSLLGYGETIKYLSGSMSFEVGSRTDQNKMAGNLPGILFCFESTTPYGVRTLLKERPDIPFVAHPTSHAWFHEPKVLWHQFNTMLKVQAVWNQKYIVSAGNHVSGKLITPQGKVMDLDTVAEGDMWTLKQTFVPKPTR